MPVTSVCEQTSPEAESIHQVNHHAQISNPATEREPSPARGACDCNVLVKITWPRATFGAAMVGLLFLILLFGNGCSMLFKRSPATARIQSLQVVTNASGKAVPLEVLQNQVQRMADTYAAIVAQAVDDLELTEKNSEARIEAMRWKLSQATAAFVDATGPNPALNVLDLVVLATVSRMVMEDEINRYFGPAGESLLETHRRLEAKAWDLASVLIKPAQSRELRDMIDEWRRQNPNQRYVGTTRFRELAAAVGKSPQPAIAAPTSIFSLLFLDPLAGLDPTAIAIEQTREMAERAMYYSQRMPLLLSWQIQLMGLQVAGQPEVKQMLSDADSFSQSTERFAKVADQLPQLVNEQREAAIKQILDGVAAERTNLLAGLAAEEQKARSLLVEARETLNAGNGMAISASQAIKSLDEFVRYVYPSNAQPATVSSNARPFNVLDYGTAAGQVGLAAKDLNALLASANQTTPELARLSQRTAADATRLVHRLFWLGVVLILVLLAGSVLAGLVYRNLANRLANRSSISRPESRIQTGI
jgi:hypothetical protein